VSFEVHRNIKVKADIPPAIPKRHEIEKEKTDDKHLQQQNIEDLIEIIEGNVPTREQRMKISADTNDKINYEINKNLLKY